MRLPRKHTRRTDFRSVPFASNLLPALLVIAAFANSLCAAEVRVSLSSREVLVGTPVALQLEISGAISHQPPTIPPLEGIDVQPAGPPERYLQAVFVDGRLLDAQTVHYSWRLTPRRAGRFEIPPLAVQVEGRRATTEPLAFTVMEPNGGDLLVAQVSADKKEPYVGEPITLTLQIRLKPYRDPALNHALSERKMWNCVSAGQSNWGLFGEQLQGANDGRVRIRGQRVSRPDAHGRQREYYLYEIARKLIPRQPGKLEFGPLHVHVDYPTRLKRQPTLFGIERYVVDEQRAIVAPVSAPVVMVRAVPANGRPADYRGAVGRYQWKAEAVPVELRAGDPLTLRLQVTGDGPLESLPAPPMEKIDALRRRFQVPEGPPAGVIDGNTKTFTIRIRPRDASVEEIPPLPLSYFDPATGQFGTAWTDAISLRVEPAEELSLDALVWGRRPLGSSAPTVSAQRLIHYQGDEVLASRYALGPTLVAVLAWLGPMLFVGAMFSRRRRGPVAVSILLVASIPVWSVREAETLKLTEQQRRQVLADAERAYARGVRMADGDVAEAKQAFQGAADRYELLVRSGIVNDKLYANLGHAYLRSGATGRAIAGYRSALRIRPDDQEIQDALRTARTIAADAAGDGRLWIEPPPDRWTAWWGGSAAVAVLFAVAIAAWNIAWISSAGNLLFPAAGWKWAAGAAAVLILFCLVMLVIPTTESPLAVIVEDGATAYSGPARNLAPATDRHLPEGATFRCLKRRLGWQCVEIEGRSGWIADQHITLVTPNWSLKF